jgi:hypothetical protein
MLARLLNLNARGKRIGNCETKWDNMLSLCVSSIGCKCALSGGGVYEHEPEGKKTKVVIKNAS